ncbi:Thylakoid lumenal 15.0 kDa protein 2, chloroplastic [Capsicum annuum]|nr:Thylakoid lumenal 15.0 kDa protein 2, chloroplastic [Capsicum annuum]
MPGIWSQTKLLVLITPCQCSELLNISLAPDRGRTSGPVSQVGQHTVDRIDHQSVELILVSSSYFITIKMLTEKSTTIVGVGVADGKVGVNKPELLPKEFTPVIDVAGFLSDGQEKRLAQEITDIEKDTGFKLRVLAQNYPDTPGLAIKDFWQVDDRTIVFVADPTFGNILNFNVGVTVDLDIPRSFWSRLAGTYGNMFYWKEKGEDASIEAAVMAISSCLREPVGPNNCSEIK